MDIVATYRAGDGVRMDTAAQHVAAPSFMDLFGPNVMTISSSYVTLASDLRPYSLKRRNQGAAGTCVPHSALKAAEIKRVVIHGPDAHIDLSRADLYFKTREIMSPPETDRDEGTQISLAAEALSRFGVATEAPLVGRPESECWPYSDDLQYLCRRPSWMATRHANLHKMRNWAKIKLSGTDLVEALIANLAVKNPVPWAKPIDRKQWNSGADVIVPCGGDSEGNHATCLVGWDPNYMGGVFIDENSWGENWGHGGFAFVSPEKVMREGFDFVVMAGGWEQWAS